METSDELRAFIRAALATGSQVHAGALTYVRHAQCPVMKRDLVYRRQFTAEEIDRFLGEQFGETAPMRRRIIEDLVRRQPVPRSRPWRWLLYTAGVI
jgi:hypothetical protein